MRKIPNYEQFLQFSNHGVIATDKDGRIQYQNQNERGSHREAIAQDQ
jgi:hypothetical protein